MSRYTCVTPAPNRSCASSQSKARARIVSCGKCFCAVCTSVMVFSGESSAITSSRARPAPAVSSRSVPRGVAVVDVQAHPPQQVDRDPSRCRARWSPTPLARSSRPTVAPKPPKPAMSTACLAVDVRRPRARPHRGRRSAAPPGARDEQQQRRDRHRQRDRRHQRPADFAAAGRRAASANENSTKANSPTCARANAQKQRVAPARGGRRGARPNSTTTLTTSIADDQARRRVSGLRRSSPKSIDAPTAMKNSPSSRPLNGSMSLSSSWRYSLSASTTPARKVPSAGDRPNRCHQQRDADHQQQRRGGEHLAQPRARDLAEGRPQHESPARDHQADRRQHRQRLAPGRQVRHERRGRAPRRDRPPAAGASSGNTRQHRDDGDVLEQQHRERRSGRPAVLSRPFSLSVCRTIAVDDSDRISRWPAADCHGRPSGQRRAGHEQRGQRHLQPAEAEDRAAQPPQQRRLQLQADQEQHHHHAELGEVHHVARRPAEQPQAEGADGDAGQQVAEHRAQPQPLCERHRQHGRAEVDERLEQQARLAHRCTPRGARRRAHRSASESSAAASRCQRGRLRAPVSSSS